MQEGHFGLILTFVVFDKVCLDMCSYVIICTVMYQSISSQGLLNGTLVKQMVRTLRAEQHFTFTLVFHLEFPSALHFPLVLNFELR